MYIGVDLGSTNIKAALYDENMQLLARKSAPVEYIRDNGFVEFDAARYCEDLVTLLAEVTRGQNCTSLAQIAFTGQAESLVVLDQAGSPLMNAISWMDERSVRECDDLAEKFSSQMCEAVTGQQAVLPTWPATKILWLKRNRPEIYENAACYMLLKDYIVYCLTGVKAANILFFYLSTVPIFSPFTTLIIFSGSSSANICIVSLFSRPKDAAVQSRALSPLLSIST